ncbi:MAG: hypothetical protein WA764_18455, partial [Pseudolabrys sp.]
MFSSNREPRFQHTGTHPDTERRPTSVHECCHRMVIPRDPESSNLMLWLDWRAAPELRMPHSKKQLSSCDRSSIRRNAIVRDPSTSPTVNSKSRLNGAVDISCHIK